MYEGSWKEGLIDINHTAVGQFTGYDADRDSLIIDMGKSCTQILMLVPTIDSATVSIGVCRTMTETEEPVMFYEWVFESGTPDAIADIALTFTASTGKKAIPINVFGARYLRIRLSADQTADRTFYFKGVD